MGRVVIGQRHFPSWMEKKKQYLGPTGVTFLIFVMLIASTGLDGHLSLIIGDLTLYG